MAKKKHSTGHRKHLLLPDAQKVGPSAVMVPFPVEKGGSLRQEYLIWNVETYRAPNGEWRITVQYVEEDGKTGHRMDLPPQVAKVVYSQHDTIIARSKSAGARKAHETRAARGSEGEDGKVE